MGGCFFPFRVLPVRNVPTDGDDTITYPVAPEASTAASFADFSEDTFLNGLVFSGEDFDAESDGDADADDAGTGSVAGLLGTTVGAEYEAIGGVPVASMFRFRFISKFPIFSFSSAMSVSSQTSRTNSSKPLGKVGPLVFFFSDDPRELLSKEATSGVAATVVSDALTNGRNTLFLVPEEKKSLPLPESPCNNDDVFNVGLRIEITPAFSIVDCTCATVLTEQWKERRTAADSMN